MPKSHTRRRPGGPDTDALDDSAAVLPVREAQLARGREISRMGWMVERPVLASSESEPTAPALLASWLAGYDPDDFYDEAFAGPGRPRPHYRPLARTLGSLTAREVGERRLRLGRGFMKQGVTFTVYKDDAGLE